MIEMRALGEADWPRVRDIYAEGIASGDATFQTDVPDWKTWDRSRLRECRIVAERDGQVVGFAALSPTSSREVYRGVCEVMVYVAAEARGQGAGRALVGEVVARSEAAGIWTLQAGIFPENVASVRAHLSAGFREVGRRERIGRFHDGRWRDTVLLERRSPVVGTG